MSKQQGINQLNLGNEVDLIGRYCCKATQVRKTIEGLRGTGKISKSPLGWGCDAVAVWGFGFG